MQVLPMPAAYLESVSQQNNHHMVLQKYHAVEEYKNALEAFAGTAGAMLFEFARFGEGNRDTIIANAVARSSTMSRGIFALYAKGDYQDSWIPHRCLIERLFHLDHLAENDEFEIFEEWSFWEQYGAVRRVQEDAAFGPAAFTTPALTPEQKARASRIRAKQYKWVRPKAEDVASRLDMHFLYRYGYDYASRYVHPMADDGARDFYSITGLQPAPDFPDEPAVLSNTLLVATLLVQTAMNASSLRWMRVMYQFFEDLRLFLDDGGDVYKSTFVTARCRG